VAAVNLSTRTIFQLMNMYTNGVITIDELIKEIARRSASEEFSRLKRAGERRGVTWDTIDPFGEVKAAFDNGQLTSEGYRL